MNGWRKQPFTPKMENGKLYGLGSNDAGASVVSLFQAYRYLTSVSQSYNLIFLASCEEEVSGKGGIESVLPQLPPIALGVVGEPTGMQPAIAEKGLMVLDVTAHGKAGHAAREEETMRYTRCWTTSNGSAASSSRRSLRFWDPSR